MPIKRVWLKLDKASRVQVRAGGKNVEIKLVLPAANLRRQLERLHEKAKK